MFIQEPYIIVTYIRELVFVPLFCVLGSDLIARLFYVHIGNLKEPVMHVDHMFCDMAKQMHEQFTNSESLKDITLR